MGKVLVQIKVENLIDVGNSVMGNLPESKIRSIQVDALVDTGAGLLCLNPDLIQKLGLRFLREAKVDTAEGSKKAKVYRDAVLNIMDRSCPIDVIEVRSTIPALVGYFPLQVLDLVVDPKNERLIPNPEHGDQLIYDLL